MAALNCEEVSDSNDTEELEDANTSLEITSIVSMSNAVTDASKNCEDVSETAVVMREAEEVSDDITEAAGDEKEEITAPSTCFYCDETGFDMNDTVSYQTHLQTVHKVTKNAKLLALYTLREQQLLERGNNTLPRTSSSI